MSNYGKFEKLEDRVLLNADAGGALGNEFYIDIEMISQGQGYVINLEAPGRLGDFYFANNGHAGELSAVPVSDELAFRSDSKISIYLSGFDNSGPVGAEMLGSFYQAEFLPADIDRPVGQIKLDIPVSDFTSRANEIDIIGLLPGPAHLTEFTGGKKISLPSFEYCKLMLTVTEVESQQEGDSTEAAQAPSSQENELFQMLDSSDVFNAVEAAESFSLSKVDSARRHSAGEASQEVSGDLTVSEAAAEGFYYLTIPSEISDAAKQDIDELDIPAQNDESPASEDQSQEDSEAQPVSDKSPANESDFDSGETDQPAPQRENQRKSSPREPQTPQKAAEFARVDKNSYEGALITLSTAAREYSQLSSLEESNNAKHLPNSAKTYEYVRADQNIASVKAGLLSGKGKIVSALFVVAAVANSLINKSLNSKTLLGADPDDQMDD